MKTKNLYPTLVNNLFISNSFNASLRDVVPVDYDPFADEGNLTLIFRQGAIWVRDLQSVVPYREEAYRCQFCGNTHASGPDAWLGCSICLGRYANECKKCGNPAPDVCDLCGECHQDMEHSLYEAAHRCEFL